MFRKISLEKRQPFCQFSSKLSEIFFGERFENSDSFFNFWEHIFWLGCVVQKKDDHAPYGLFLQLMSALTKHKFDKVWWKLKKCQPYPAGTFAPLPASFRVNGHSLTRICNFFQLRPRIPYWPNSLKDWFCCLFFLS